MSSTQSTYFPRSSNISNASLTSSYIGVGNGSNLLSGNSDFIKGAYVVELNQSSGGQQVGFMAKNTSATSGNTNASLFVDNGTSAGQLFKAGTNYSAYKNISAHDLGFYNNSVAGNISVLNDYGNINFAANGSSSITATITNAGIGIGISTPSVALDVVGEVKVMGNVGIGEIPIPSSILVVGDISGTYLDIDTTNKVSIFKSANSNGFKLRLDGSALDGGVGYLGDTEGDNYETLITVDDRETGGQIIKYNANNGHQFTGNVGIGTSAPTSTLHVNGSVNLKVNVIADEDYTVLDTDYMISCKNWTADWTITLPTGIIGRTLIFVPSPSANDYRTFFSADVVDEQRNGHDNIRSSIGGTITIMYDGTDWQVITNTKAW